MKSYTLSGSWTVIKEVDHEGAELSKAIPSAPSYTLTVPHQYDQNRWKYDYAYSRAVSRYHGYVWYYRSFEPVEAPRDGLRYRLEFDRVSYYCAVYLNGEYIGEHRHSEERFSFDVTDKLSYDGENLLAVRCFEPVCGCEAIDGIRLDLIPNGFWAGSENTPNLFPIDSAGGILEDVRVTAHPTLRITDVFAHPDPKTGRVSLDITIENHEEAPRDTCVTVRFSDTKHGMTLTDTEARITANSGESIINITANIPNYKLWELNSPTLYRAEISVSGGEARSLRFGFKELLVRKGFFFLNGRRVILKCAHGTPSAETVIQMKSMGFNAFRSIQQVVPEEVLDLCDELGFLIIESPLTSWGMRFHENTRSMVEDSLCNMVKMHRSHVSIGAFYLFNELKRREILHTGSECLPKLRSLAPNALFLLSSGRWDLEYELGSVSNPYSHSWERLLGNEGSADNIDHLYPSRFHVVHNIGMGDLHPYVYVPLENEAKKWFRTVGEEGEPIFISECGIGTQDNPMRCYFERLATGYSKDGDSIKEVSKVCSDLEDFLAHYGMEEVYPFATDICRDSDRENGRQRQMLFDLIRSNPKISGFSLTSWGEGNEGTLEGAGVIKESVAYAMQEGWAPLRWALFTESRVLYTDRPFTLEAVLCNEDVLPPATYRAQAKIKGRQGIVWSKDFDAVYPHAGHGGLPPLAATVLLEELSLPAGEYTLSVRLLEGGCPYGGQLKFTVSAPAIISPPSSVTSIGLSAATKELLGRNGVKTAELDENTDCGALLVGLPENYSDPSLWERIFALAEGGATVVFLNSELFAKEECLPYLKKIAGDGAKCGSTIDWLYHFDSVHIRHPLFYNIHDEGLIELDAFTELYPRQIFTRTEKADKTICASLRVDAGNCATSLSIGEYNMGSGRVVLNDFRIEEALGKNPYADQMLFNFIDHYFS